jgi:ribosomal protein S18 acetylase RimI-like enzyme
MTVDWIIRDLDKGSEEELDIITRLCMAAVLESIPEFQGDAEQARRYLANFTFDQMRAMIHGDFPKPDRRFLVAVGADGAIVGHIILTRKVDPEGRAHGYLFSCYVLPAHRRGGIAEALIADAEEWYRAAGLPYVAAHTHQHNVAILGLLDKRRYLIDERRSEPWPHVRVHKNLEFSHKS